MGGGWGIRLGGSAHYTPSLGLIELGGYGKVFHVGEASEHVEKQREN